MPDKVKVSCPNCGVTNNYPLNAGEKKVVCGRCKNPLPEPGTVIEPLPGQAYNLFQNSGLPLLIDFYSPTCAPCRMMHPVLENLARRRAGEVTVLKVDVNQHPQLATEFRIQAVPTFVILYKGRERGRASGAQSEADFALWVASKI